MWDRVGTDAFVRPAEGSEAPRNAAPIRV